MKNLSDLPEEEQHKVFRNQLIKVYGLMEVNEQGKLIERYDLDSPVYTVAEGIEIQFTGIEVFGQVKNDY